MRKSVMTLLAVFGIMLISSAAMSDGLVTVWTEDAGNTQVTSSWWGSTGMILTPSASTLKSTHATVAAHQVDRDERKINLFSLNVGVTDWLELGAANVELSDGSDELMGNLKFRLPMHKWLDNLDFPQVAVGVWDVTNQVDRAYYMVLSKRFPVNKSGSSLLDLHLGFGGSDSGDGALEKWFGGMEFSAFRKGKIQAEYDGDNFNAALRYFVAPRVSVDVGTLDGDFGWGATYRSGF